MVNRYAADPTETRTWTRTSLADHLSPDSERAQLEMIRFILFACVLSFCHSAGEKQKRG
jgi:hypothetical protein